MRSVGFRVVGDTRRVQQVDHRARAEQELRVEIDVVPRDCGSSVASADRRPPRRPQTTARRALSAPATLGPAWALPSRGCVRGRICGSVAQFLCLLAAEPAAHLSEVEGGVTAE